MRVKSGLAKDGPQERDQEHQQQRQLQRARGRVSALRTFTAALLVGCYAAACVWSLWSRLHAIEFFAVASLASAGFVVVSSTGRVVLGVLADLAAGGVALILPAIGDALDGVAALLAVSLMSGKFLRLVKTLPFGLACAGLYLGLWSLARHLPAPLQAAAGHHFGPQVALTAVLVAVAAVLYLALVAGLAHRLGKEWTAAVFHTVGYPWVLLMFIATFFVPDRHPAQA